ncbi:acetyl-CoA carboxylase biotin carboxylase subunit [Mesorhizobium sp. Z1-4]|uniref:acetyl/propionyl/methylcrotonyl-CoA carboxylase subunit alpha n=1 Tax=Mesorhizobium sp. Z1-4 TaxID=2448478 RepID=UPI002479E618|nr:acetyl-CoA carboxylase biotin carboxylase subunit [Mesorhizobium sp. Z1-4]
MTKITKLLIANRGEIAVRVMRTARQMGIATVAVYSEADKGAVHMTSADEAVCIGGAAPAESYLRVDAIIEAARATGADAIHPGYGFLAENPALSAACADAGIIFVGPSAEAIANMGDKAAAKRLMEAAGVPCVPGYDGADQTPATLLAKAKEIGFPIMIKATAGGGGRGMRLVNAEADFEAALSSAVSEAKSAFGDGTVLLERAIVNPRHVEIQIMADCHGNAIHLGERDCSVQRRHQKLIEEAPSPAVDASLRARMGEASVKAALAIGYEGAGTFEYLLDSDGQFYFMEMNTRLQVEHPVTEAVTGLDLVELQLRIAAGEALPLGQADVTISGHAVEVRLCAEDPDEGFMPQSGRLARWKPANNIRADHALRDGADIPPFYDSMIAKLIAHGSDRDAALRKLIAGLGETQALGVRTNQRFLADCLRHPVFAAGQATTAFIADQSAELMPDREDEDRAMAGLAGALMRAADGTSLAHGFAAPLGLARGERVFSPRIVAYGGGRCEIHDGGEVRSVRVTGRDRDSIQFEDGGRSRKAGLVLSGGVAWLHLDGRSRDFTDLTFAPEVTADAAGDGKVRASMNGTVVSVAVKAGDAVAKGQTMLVLEAMKMEHAHVAGADGTVAAVHVEPGAQVTAHAVLAEIEIQS